MKSWAAGVWLAAAAAAGAADYAVDGLTETATARVRAAVEKPAAEFTMPAWAPGDYQIFNYGEKVLSLSAKLRGEPVAAVKAGDNRWTFPQGADEVDYIVTQSGGNFSPNLRVRPGEIFISGPGVFGVFAGDERNRQRLTQVALDGVPIPPVVALPRDDAGAWIARDYDHFLDSPIAASSLMQLLQLEAGGKPHEVAIYGRNAAGAVAEPFDPVIRPIVEQTKAIFGELPYEKYVFFADIQGGFGGLEHQDSCRLTLSRLSPRGAEDFIAHEFFHTFNVKRIRERPLGSFDYTKPAPVETLWWLEGVTDYYAGVVNVRGGLKTRDDFARELTRLRGQLSRSPNAAVTSARESSLRVWERRGSQGYGISYYAKGKIIGWLLDLAIRQETNGAKSLDDVMRALYQETKSGPGYEPSRIRELCVKVGGEALGPLYDRAVNEPGDIPIDPYLAAFGLDEAQSPPRLKWPEALAWEASPEHIGPALHCH